MTTAAQATAAPCEIRLGGQTFRMSPLTDRDIAELDLWLQMRVLRIARASLPPDASDQERRLTEDVALSKAASLTWMGPEGAKLMATLEGMARLVWQGVKANHPEVTPEEVRGLLLDAQSVNEAREAFDRLNLGAADRGDGSKKKHPKHKKRWGRRGR